MADIPEVVLLIDGARKEYGHVRALQGAHLEVRRGEILALVGDNGAGKSTLLKSLCGAIWLDSGTIKIHGREVQLTSVETAKDLGLRRASAKDAFRWRSALSPSR